MARHNRMTFSKLTPEQRELAEVHHGLIYAFLNKYKLSTDDYYDIAAIGLIKAVQAYNTKQDVHKYGISTVIWHTIYREIGHHWLYSARQRRTPENSICSLDIPEAMYILESQSAKTNENLWEHMEYDDLVKQIYRVANKKQRQIIQLILLGYRQTEISKKLGISYSSIWYNINLLRNRIIELGILEPRYVATKR